MTTTPRSRAHRTAAAAAALTLLAAPLLTGCFSGIDATTTMQANQPSGNGVDAHLQGLEMENITIVAGPEGSRSGTLIGTVFNEAEAPDALMAVTINGTPATIAPASPTVIPGAGTVNFGYDGTNFINTYTLEAQPSAFVPVTLQFQNAGTVEVKAMIVPPTGTYAGIAPTPAMG